MAGKASGIGRFKPRSGAPKATKPPKAPSFKKGGFPLEVKSPGKDGKYR